MKSCILQSFADLTYFTHSIMYEASKSFVVTYDVFILCSFKLQIQLFLHKISLVDSVPRHFSQVELALFLNILLKKK